MPTFSNVMSPASGHVPLGSDGLRGAASRGNAPQCSIYVTHTRSVFEDVQVELQTYSFTGIHFCTGKVYLSKRIRAPMLPYVPCSTMA